MKGKRFLAACLTAVISFGVMSAFAACGKSNADEGGLSPEEEAAVESGDVVMAFIQGTNNKPDLDLVQNKASDYCKEKYGFGVKFKPVNIFDQTSVYTNWLAGGEDLDVLNLCFMDQFQYINEKRIRPLTKLLTKEYAPWLSENMDKNPESKLIGTDGKLYGVGTIEPVGGIGGGSILINTDILNRIGMLGENAGQYQPYDKVGYEDLDRIFAAIDALGLKDSGGGKCYPCPLMASTAPYSAFAPFDMLSNSTTEVIAVLDIEPNNQTTTKVVNYYETEDYKKYVEKVGEWYEKGYIMKNADTTKDQYPDLLSTGKWVAMFCSYSAGLGVQYDDKTHQYTQLWIGDPYYTFNGVPSMSMAINSKSKRPKNAMRFIDAIYSDEYLVNLVQYGIEGKHWKFAEEQKSKYITGTEWNIENKGYSDLPGVYGNKAMLYTYTAPTDNMAERIALVKKAEEIDFINAEKARENSSPAVGFVYDSKKQKNRIKSIVGGPISQYLNQVNCGRGKKGTDGTFTGPGSTYADFIAALKRNNVASVVEDKQQQLDEWLKNQK